MKDLFIRGIIIDWDSIDDDNYLKEIESINNQKEIYFNNSITFFVGENGSGKSTLLEAIALGYGFNAEGGTKNYNFSTYDSHSELYEHSTLIKGSRFAKWGYFLRAESFYNVASKEEEYSRGPMSINSIPPQHFHEKSHGESFIQLTNSFLKPNSIYIFDEPEAVLSPQRQLTLLYQIDKCLKQGSQFIIATHSPILLGYPGADILCFDGKIHNIEYEDTDNYKLTKMFINSREQVLKNLLND